MLRDAGWVRDTTSVRPLFHWCDPARPVELSVIAEDDPEHEFSLMMAEVIADDPSARTEYAEILQRADREETRQWERARCGASRS
ncbi:hypothetical protein ACFSSF_08845 [Dietzia aerolata]